jgi:hypothetical protein
MCNGMDAQIRKLGAVKKDTAGRGSLRSDHRRFCVFCQLFWSLPLSMLLLRTLATVSCLHRRK